MTAERSVGSLPDGLLAAFGIEGTVASIERLSGGHIHRTFRVRTAGRTDRAGGPEHADADIVVQAVNAHVFQDLNACENNLDRIARRFESETSVRVPVLLRTIGGRVHWVDHVGTAWRMSEFATGTETATAASQPDEAFAVAQCFGKYVHVLSSEDVSNYRLTIPGFHDLDRRRSDFERALNDDGAGRVRQCNAVIQLARRIADSDITASLQHLPMTVVHNDAKVSNLRVDASGRPLVIVDLDTTMAGSALFDLGELLRTATTDAAEDEADPSNVQVDPDRIDAVIAGFCEGAGSVMTEALTAVLPIAGPRMAFENAIRFLADFVAGDVYFAVSDPEQNLRRATTQLRITEQLWRDRLRRHA